MIGNTIYIYLQDHNIYKLSSPLPWFFTFHLYVSSKLFPTSFFTLPSSSSLTYLEPIVADSLGGGLPIHGAFQRCGSISLRKTVRTFLPSGARKQFRMVDGESFGQNISLRGCVPMHATSRCSLVAGSGSVQIGHPRLRGLTLKRL